MPLRREEIRNLIAACEVIQGFLANGQKYTEEERALIEYCIHDLLKELRANHSTA